MFSRTDLAKHVYTFAASRYYPKWDRAFADDILAQYDRGETQIWYKFDRLSFWEAEILTFKTEGSILYLDSVMDIWGHLGGETCDPTSEGIRKKHKADRKECGYRGRYGKMIPYTGLTEHFHYNSHGVDKFGLELDIATDDTKEP
jgi:hypothetical protein